MAVLANSSCDLGELSYELNITLDSKKTIRLKCNPPHKHSLDGSRQNKQLRIKLAVGSGADAPSQQMVHYFARIETSATDYFVCMETSVIDVIDI